MTFSAPGMHGLTYADDFWSAAGHLRDELLMATGWAPMTHYDATGFSAVDLEWQNGLTLSNLRAALHADAFRSYLHEHRRELCALAGLDAATADACDVEMNGMAYGEGCRLASHTEFLPT